MKNLLPKSCLCILFLLVTTIASACPFCNPQIREAIYNSRFYPNLFSMLSAFIALAALVLLLTYFNKTNFKRYKTGYSSHNHLSPVPLTTAAMVLGIGIGGFIDGIVFHQILQWHECFRQKFLQQTILAKASICFGTASFMRLVWL